jgi:hypothetical protein
MLKDDENEGPLSSPKVDLMFKVAAGGPIPNVFELKFFSIVAWLWSGR